MDQYAYIDILRETLATELSERKVREHIQYYEKYIEESIRSGKRWEDVLQELGDPRLIAKTIIDTDKISQDYFDKGASNSNNSYYEEPQSTDNNYNNNNRNPYVVSWYTKLIGIIITIVVIFGVIILGTVALRLLFTIGLPIFIIYIIIRLFQNIFRSKY